MHTLITLTYTFYDIVFKYLNICGIEYVQIINGI